MAERIQARQLTEKDVIFVRGNVTFARLLNKIEGDELEQDMARKARMGRSVINKPYTTVTITNAKIVPQDKVNGTLTLAEQFVQQHFYKRKDDAGNPNAPDNYSRDNLSPFDNRFYLANNGDYKNVTEFTPSGEFAPGMDVLLILSVIQPKGTANKGIALDGIIAMEEPKYYQSSRNAALTNAGITVHANPSVAETPAAPVEDPAPGEAFQTQPPADTAPVVEPPAEANEPAGAWTCPNCGNENPATMQFCGQCGTQKGSVPKPIGGSNPYAPGIRP